MLRKLTRGQAYLSCYGFCEVDEATEPFCGNPVERDVEEASPSEVEVAHSKITATAELDDTPEVHENYRISNFISRRHLYCFPQNSELTCVDFCGVPGQACGEKMVETDTASAERFEPTVSAARREGTVSAARRRSTTTPARSEITPAPEVVDVEERDADPKHTLPNFISMFLKSRLQSLRRRLTICRLLWRPRPGLREDCSPDGCPGGGGAGRGSEAHPP